MDTKSFDKLLLKTAFCCMASDGHIDKREISTIKLICDQSPIFIHFNYKDEINTLLHQINTTGKEFIKDYFEMLEAAQISEEEELTLIDFAIQTIMADEQIEYSEIKFFKNIRHRLKVSDEIILSKFPDIEMYLEEDIISDSFLDKITKQFFEETELPQFELLELDTDLIIDTKERNN